MELVQCEAPLDNSFQKDRRELVNKGSLGRRRKPSRSNLKLILSPAKDQQDIDLVVQDYKQRLDFESGRLIREPEASVDNRQGSFLDNQQELVKFGHRSSSNITSNHEHTSRVSVASNNYREVVASINRINSAKSVDVNGNDRQSASVSTIRQDLASLEHNETVRSRQQKTKSENHILNSTYSSQTSVTKIKQNGVNANHRETAKLSNGHHNVKSNQNGVVANSHITTSESKNYQQTISIRNHQPQAVASRNQQNIITFSNHRQIVTSTPVQSKKSEEHNGRLGTTPQDRSSRLCIESSLPRTSKEPSLVAEARQFSIEAKLKRKKSDVQGRSAVLIQTWERRTQSESYTKLRRDSNSALKNRFSGKENCDANSTAMPDSYICSKYKGSLQNGDSFQKGESVPIVRDVKSQNTMVYRQPEDRHRSHSTGNIDRAVTVNGDSPVQEPEWISLSRKLCAKFVEGHIEPHSPDSFHHEEPEGVVEEKPDLNPQPIKNHGGNNNTKITTSQREAEKRKIIIAPTTPCDETSAGGEPPWIHLSRKLCNKFIEEHIEYPPITNGQLIEVPELVAPNGDVRIIEKIGKPKGHKSKQKKDCEPEWVSLSKKLRAKFIESHIDDPDTIALDNQLNASDPEETGSETLSDISQDITAPKGIVSSKPVECKNYTIKNYISNNSTTFQENGEHRRSSNYEQNPVSLQEKECCWEYQEMEFDQESLSGNFQEPECEEQPVQEIRVHRGSIPQIDPNKCEERVTFADSFSFQNAECYNNDVNFAPHNTFAESVSETSAQQNKFITVQFIAHRSNAEPEKSNKQQKGKDAGQDCPFNFTPWEQASYRDEVENDQKSSKDVPLCKDLRSKSLDNLCDSLEEKNPAPHKKYPEKERRVSSHSNDGFETVEYFLTKSEEALDEKENSQAECKSDLLCTCDIPTEKDSDNCNCVLDDTSFEEETQATGLDRDSFPNNTNYVRTLADTKSEIDRENTPTDKFYSQENKNNLYKESEVESSSEDEVFECDTKSAKNSSSSSESSHYGQISPGQSQQLHNEIYSTQKKINNQDVNTNSSKETGKNIHCNGMIPNSIYNGLPDSGVSSSKSSNNKSSIQSGQKEPVKMGMSKWITMSRSEQNVSKPEYSNIQSSIQQMKEKSSEQKPESKKKLKNNNAESRSNQNNESAPSSKSKDHSKSEKTNETSYSNRNSTINENSNTFAESTKEVDLKAKCKSLCDISFMSNSHHSENSFRHHESIADLSSATKSSYQPKIEFQHFDYESEIPLCAKLVSNHNKRTSRNIPSETSNYRNESPCPSENSHVYEDMFKETPSGPSDSEASSWTVMKNNTYYVNGRSSSMNDLDFSDSCSMSVKCDYASSSENSTLHSRHSSYASSSFYVNLRDYDSHMLEPNLNKSRKSDVRSENGGMSSSISKSNPPTPESLRHLFTSPLSSMHTPANRNSRLLSRMPSDPQSHYYSTAAATSSAFKHGFAPAQPKTKKTERSSSIKIKDIAHGIILTFKRFQNHSKNSNVPSNQQVDVSHLAEMKSNSELAKTKKGQKDSKSKSQDIVYWTENGKNDSDSGFLSDVQRAKARRSSSDLTGLKPNSDLFTSNKKKGKSSKKGSNKEKKSKSKTSEPRTVPTVSRKVQQMADGTLYLVTTVSGDTTLPGVYSDSPDTSSELSGCRPVKNSGESNC